jgi:hypothetical protein
LYRYGADRRGGASGAGQVKGALVESSGVFPDFGMIHFLGYLKFHPKFCIIAFFLDKLPKIQSHEA